MNNKRNVGWLKWSKMLSEVYARKITWFVVLLTSILTTKEMPKGHQYMVRRLKVFVSEYGNDWVYKWIGLTSKYWLCTMELSLLNATKETYDHIVIEYVRWSYHVAKGVKMKI